MKLSSASTAAHQIAALMPGGSRFFGPPTKSARAADIARMFGLRHEFVQPEESIDWESLRYSDGARIEFQVNVPSNLPEIGLLSARNARVLGSDGWPVVANDCLITDSHFIHEASEFRSYEKFTYLPKRQKLAGRTLNLGATFSSNNYGHALLDGLGKLAVAAKANIDPTQVDHLLLPSFITDAMERILIEAGYSRDKWVVLKRGGHIFCEELLNPGFPGAQRVYSSILPEYYRKFTDNVEQSGRRLFIFRPSGRRLLSNFADIRSSLEAFGFELYDPSGAKSSPNDFAASEIIVGAHGAGLADLVFCKPGTKVIEILPSGHRYPYFASLARAAKLNYVALPGSSTSGVSHSDFAVDSKQFHAVLEQSIG